MDRSNLFVLYASSLSKKMVEKKQVGEKNGGEDETDGVTVEEVTLYHEINLQPRASWKKARI